MGIALRAGNEFAGLSDPSAPPQVIVNEAFVQRYLADVEPLGRRITSGSRAYIVAGIVAQLAPERLRRAADAGAVLLAARSSVIHGRDPRPYPAWRGGGDRARRPARRACAGSRAAPLQRPHAQRSHGREPRVPAHSCAHLRGARAASARRGGDGHLRDRRVCGVAAPGRDGRPARARRDADARRP